MILTARPHAARVVLLADRLEAEEMIQWTKRHERRLERLCDRFRHEENLMPPTVPPSPRLRSACSQRVRRGLTVALVLGLVPMLASQAQAATGLIVATDEIPDWKFPVDVSSQIANVKWPILSANGRYVAFAGNDPASIPDGAKCEDLYCTLADGSRLLVGDNVYVIDRETRATSLASISESGYPFSPQPQFDHTGSPGCVSVPCYGNPAWVSDDGSEVVFTGQSGRGIGVFTRDLVNGVTRRLDIPPTSMCTTPWQPCTQPWYANQVETGDVSHDGKRVLIASTGTGESSAMPVPGLYLLDRTDASLTAIDRRPDGTGGMSGQGALSADGNWAVFTSSLGDLDPTSPADSASSLYLRNIASGVTARLAVPQGEHASQPTISGDGRYVAYWAVISESPYTYRPTVVDVRTGASRRFDVQAAAVLLSADGSTLTMFSSAQGSLLSSPVFDDPVQLGSGEIASMSADARWLAAGGRHAAILDRGARATDTAPPLVSAVVDRPPDKDEWYHDPVAVSWSVVDPSPSSGQPNVPAPVVASTEGRAITYFSEPSCDPAGNCASGTISLSIDRTAPSVSVKGVEDGAVYSLGSVPTASCIASDLTSGLVSDAVLVVSGGNGDGTGTFTAVCSAVDVAGNEAAASATYQVHYAVPGGGFQGNVDQPPSLNTGKAGRTYAVQWQLQDGSGAYVSSLDVVVSETYKSVDCLAFAGDPSDGLVALTSGSSGLRYDATTDSYVYNWRTPSTPGCYKFFVILSDGNVLSANFSLS